MCSGFLVIDVFPLLLCVFLLDGSTSVVVGLSPCHCVKYVFRPNYLYEAHNCLVEFRENRNRISPKLAQIRGRCG